MGKKYKLKYYNFRLIAYVLILTTIGIQVIGSAKESVQNKQIFGALIGISLMIIVSLIDYGVILKFRRLIYLFMLVILAAILIPGVGVNVNGSTRWINIGGLQFQPSELSKILIIITLAAFFMRYQEKINEVRTILISLILIGIPLIMIYEEPDLSTTIVTVIVFAVLFYLSGLSYKIVFGFLGVIIPLGLVGILLMIKQALPLEEYQYGRILSWIQPEKFPDQARQQQNSIIAIGSGQLWGKGLHTDSILSLKNGNFISEPQTDFIFTVLGEELGFVGCLIVIILLIFIFFECILVARNAKDLGGRLLCMGIGTVIGFQGLINIGVTTGLLPNTGLPLPFVSYGLTSLVSLYIGIGLVLNVGLQTSKYNVRDNR